MFNSIFSAKGGKKSRSTLKTSQDATVDGEEDDSFADEEFAVGEKVIINDEAAIIRYIGPTSGGAGEWVGAEYLSVQKGSSDGTDSGQQLFECKPGYGIFVRPNLCAKYSEARAERGKQEAIKRKRKSFDDFVRIENADERDYNSSEAEVAQVMAILKFQYPKRAAKPKRVSLQLAQADNIPQLLVPWYEKYRALTVEDSYDGFKLPEKVRSEDMKALMRFWLKNPDKPLHKKYTYQILLKIAGLLLETSSAVAKCELQEGNDKKFIIVGDTHGQLQDVMWIFHCLGLPSSTTSYLFNGDIADRGEYAVEIFLLVFGFKLASNDGMFFNRGNHENADINERPKRMGGGFAEEVRRKYDSHVFDLWQQIFCLMPICTLVDKKIFVVHGGLARYRHTTIQQLEKVNYQRQVPEVPANFVDALLVDCLWSDPQKEDGVLVGRRGEGVVQFGPDMTTEFLADNDLELVIRSHEVPRSRRGFQLWHNDKLLTVFSASNYCGKCNNTGAVTILQKGKAPHIEEYMAPALPEIAILDEKLQEKEKESATPGAMRASLKNIDKMHQESDVDMEVDNVVALKDRIASSRQDLYNYFSRRDEKETGHITLQQWEDGLATVLKVDVDWKEYKGLLAKVLPDGTICYIDFLNRYRIELTPKYSKWQSDVTLKIFKSIIEKNMSMKETLQFFDKDGDGTVSLNEFYDVMEDIESGLSKDQLLELMHVLGIDEFSKIDTGAFIAKLQIVSKYIEQGMDTESKPKVVMGIEMEAILKSLVKSFKKNYFQKGGSLMDVFSSCDTNGDGYLDYDEFVKGMSSFQDKYPAPGVAKVTEDQLRQLAAVIDANGDKVVNYLELMLAFQAYDRNIVGPASTNSLVQQICNTLYQHKEALLKAFHYFDDDGTGEVSEEQFVNCVNVINTVIPSTPLTEKQIEELSSQMPKTESGSIGYNDFLDAFIVIDADEF